MPAKKKRLTDTVTVQEAGCHGCDKKWTTGNANQMAALHFDKTGHRTWCRIVMDISYGTDKAPVPAEAVPSGAASPPFGAESVVDAQASNDATENKAPTGSQKSEYVGFICGKCGRELGVHHCSKSLKCFKCGAAGIAYAAVATNEWREPMAESDLMREPARSVTGASPPPVPQELLPAPITPEQSIEEFLTEKATTPRFGPQGPATGPPKSIEELIADRVEKKPEPAETGPKFEM